MRVVAMGATVERPFTLPVVDALAVGAEIPILVAVRMTTTANQVYVVEVHRFSKKRLQITAGIKIVTRYAPDTPRPVFQHNLMWRIELPYFRIRFHKFVALNTRVKQQGVFSRHDSKFLCPRITLKTHWFLNNRGVLGNRRP